MSPTKKFLLIFFAVSLVVWIGGNTFLGPPSFSAEYREAYGLEHDHYIDISKSAPYKLYLERPGIHGPDVEGVDPRLAEKIAFMAAYEARPEYQAEMHRLHIYEYFFEFYNAAIVIILGVYFGRKPVANILDEKIADLKAKVEAAAAVRKEATQRKKDVEEKLKHLTEEEEKVSTATALRLKQEQAALETSNAQALERLRNELEDRKREEWKAAERLVKEELVNQSINKLQEHYRAALNSNDVAQQQGVMIDQFINELEARS